MVSGGDVIELDYYGGRKVALFNCDWIDTKTNKGTKKDELGFTLVNPSCLLKTEEPFILASQAIQVFYVEEPIETDWHAVVFTKPRDFTQSLQELMDNVNDVRDNVPGITVDSSLNIIGEGGENSDTEDEDEDEDEN
ncbi:hypothetical protein JRO89_XS04G0138800 [Xanthoceras sorbifolium]|uniref:DUF4216 domain-containing protein n=1 Tax=Xanthoceras sorbifolium TaxID=99658 RepID=A0ABQ8I561_9ROSI|nr:hypothetical protein JRO89_XS04G0138800 [Xanthoceras sorbifolium]